MRFQHILRVSVPGAVLIGVSTLGACQGARPPAEVGEAPAATESTFVPLGASGYWTAYRNEWAEDPVDCSADAAPTNRDEGWVEVYPTGLAFWVDPAIYDVSDLRNPILAIDGQELPLEYYSIGRSLNNRLRDGRLILLALRNERDFAIEGWLEGERLVYEFRGLGFTDAFQLAMSECDLVGFI